MRMNLLIFALCLAVEMPTHAQGIITFTNGGPNNTLTINFVALSNSPVTYFPTGGGSYVTGSGGSFGLGVTAIAPTNIDPFSMSIHATILQMGGDGTLTPVVFPGGNPAFNISLVTLGTPATVVFGTSSLPLSSGLSQELLARQVYLEADFSYGEYLGQVSPAPEPSGIALACLGGALLWYLRSSSARKGPRQRQKR